ncbi:MAG: cation diffusion facilitator family transporter [Armatimonadetes bacterium]|nr:cation diffusion facilitator family transporter [Armatimonadota bacterium]
MTDNTHKRKAAVALLSVISNSTLVALKLIVGLLIGSVSVLSEAIHSGVDLLAAIIALFAVNTAGKPADEDHPFGHGKVENISGTIEALLIFVAAVWIVFEAVKKLLHAEPLDAPGLGVGVMLVSAVANIVVSHMLFKVGKETESPALQADGWHLRTDVYTSGGVMVGLGLIWLGKLLLPGLDLRWLDPIAAIAVALLIVRAAYRLTIESGRDLMDVSLPPEEEQWIRDYVKGLSPTVRAFHRLRTRKAGSQRFVQFHLLVSGDMSVEESHSLNDKIVVAIKEKLRNCNVTIHIEPCDGKCAPTCLDDCLVSRECDRQ